MSGLYLIPFLHQTTTVGFVKVELKGCILFHFYIKPQQFTNKAINPGGCILFHFYIKPQLCKHFVCDRPVVSYSISTSNHNSSPSMTAPDSLYLIPFLHQTTTLQFFRVLPHRCILFHFYIKPQPTECYDSNPYVVSYSISTSNHNEPWTCPKASEVVSYSISTSNHNPARLQKIFLSVVSYSISTSNHNLLHGKSINTRVVSYSISTSNHNLIERVDTVTEVVSYSISTSNHNTSAFTA